jgi:hypothetical protein
MKKIAILLALSLLLSCAVPALAGPVTLPMSALQALGNNCPTTGRMLPELFDPLVQTYLLTVASWVSRVTFTPVSVDPLATITVNGQYVASGHESQIIQMTNDPQAVTVSVTSSTMENTVYTVFLQRRPSEARTRVSVGYLKDMYLKDGKYYMSLDLVTANYTAGYTNYTSAFTNDSTALYKNAVWANCVYYWGSMNSPSRSRDPVTFLGHVTLDGTEMFRVVYLEDEIVAVMPYDIH